FALPLAYGAVRLPQVRAAREEAPSLRVGVVQPNIGIHDKHDPRLHVAQLRALRAATAALEARGAELVLWPESAYPFAIHRNLRADREGPLGLRQDGVQGPILTGVVSTDGTQGVASASDERGALVGRFVVGTGARYNSALGIHRDGTVAGIADKVHLLAFGEYTPLWDQIAWLHVFPRGLTPGVGPQIVELAGCHVAVLNCYEDLLPDHVRAQAAHAPSFFANLTNDAWFGDTSAPHLH